MPKDTDYRIRHFTAKVPRPDDPQLLPAPWPATSAQVHSCGVACLVKRA
jgi:hypothetical protein